MPANPAAGLKGHARRSSLKSLGLLALDVGLYVATVIGTIRAEQEWLRLIFSLGAGVMIALLAIVGHDAGHQSFSPSRRLNRACATLAFLPALHPYSLWVYHHNVIHHRYTVQLGVDNAFPPMTVSAYQSASQWQRQKYRFLRSLWGQPFFYLIDVWLPHMFLPWLKRQSAPPCQYGLDLALVYVYLGAYTAIAISWNQQLHGMDLGSACFAALLYSLAIPLVLWNAFISFLSIVQHTAPCMHWIPPTGHPTPADVALASTMHVIFPGWLDRLTHRSLQHPAHHCHEGIPLHHLRQAQSTLQATMPKIRQSKWTPSYHWQITQTCQLYDPDSKQWRRFSDVN